jgi:hypothetical protein
MRSQGSGRAAPAQCIPAGVRSDLQLFHADCTSRFGRRPSAIEQRQARRLRSRKHVAFQVGYWVDHHEPENDRLSTLGRLPDKVRSFPAVLGQIRLTTASGVLTRKVSDSSRYSSIESASWER